MSNDLSSRRTWQRTLLSRDSSWVEELTTSPSAGATWRYRGLTPSPDSFLRNLWAGVSLQHVVFDRRELGETARIGLLTAYRNDYRSQTAFLSALFSEQWWNSGLPIEAAVVFIEHSFQVLNLRKLYVESLSINWQRFSSLSNIGFQVEGRLLEYELVNGVYEDLIYAAIDRESWKSVYGRVQGVVLK